MSIVTYTADRCNIDIWSLLHFIGFLVRRHLTNVYIYIWALLYTQFENCFENFHLLTHKQLWCFGQVAKERAVESLLLPGGKFVLNVLGQGKVAPITKQLLKPFKPGEPRYGELNTKESKNGGRILLDAVKSQFISWFYLSRWKYYDYFFRTDVLVCICLDIMDGMHSWKQNGNRRPLGIICNSWWWCLAGMWSLRVENPSLMQFCTCLGKPPLKFSNLRSTSKLWDVHCVSKLR